jgi:PAS domain S-box-containing protein
MKPKVTPTSKERVMRENDFIVSKTDLKGFITYCNRIFMEFADYSEEELLGQNHNIIRHPDMPSVIFKVLWDEIQSGREVNAYVKNLSSDGGFYWVFANITPVVNGKGEKVGYSAVRRAPDREKLNNVIIPLYQKLLDEEKKHSKKSDGIEASYKLLNSILDEKGKSYEEFILTI